MLRFPRDYDADKTEFRHSEPLDFVELRDSDRNPINYRDTRETNRIRYILRQNALVNDAALIQVHRDNASCTFKSTKLHAVFNNGSFDLGGRLYTSGEDGGYQHLSKEERKRLFINREPTVELDYSGLHPRMLYAWEGIQFPNDGDPYMTVHDNPQLRPLLKKLLLVFLNSKNDIEAVSAGNNEIHEMCQDGDFTFHPLDKKFGVTVKELLGRFKEAHQAISKYFCSGVANKVMNADSKIALSIIEHFGKRKIPILAIHDSFIVQRKYRDELHRVMDEAYQSKTGGFTCPIKEV